MRSVCTSVFSPVCTAMDYYVFSVYWYPFGDEEAFVYFLLAFHLSSSFTVFPFLSRSLSLSLSLSLSSRFPSPLLSLSFSLSHTHTHTHNLKKKAFLEH